MHFPFNLIKLSLKQKVYSQLSTLQAFNATFVPYVNVNRSVYQIQVDLATLYNKMFQILSWAAKPYVEITRQKILLPDGLEKRNNTTLSSKMINHILSDVVLFLT